MLSGVNMLTSSLKISDTSKTEFFELIFFQSNQKIWEKYFCPDLSSVSDPLTCWLYISVLIRGSLGIEVTPLFAVYNFIRKWTLRLIFCFNVIQILFRFRKCRKESHNTFFDLEIIAFDLVALNTGFKWERILVIGCQFVKKQSQDFGYYEKRFFGADSFSEWSKNMTKIFPWTPKQFFAHFNMLTVHKCADTGLFSHLSNPAFCSL